MKILIRIGLALVVLGVLALGALAVLGPRIVKSDAVRELIEDSAREALGTEVRYAELDFGLLPPSLLVEQPLVAGVREGAPPFVEAQRIALRVGLLPLLSGVVVVDSLVVEGATVRLARTPQGLELPLPPAAEGEPAGAPEPAPPPDEGAGESPAAALALRSVALSGATLIFEDRVVEPAATFEVALDARVTGSSPDAPFDLAATLGLSTGGTVSVDGQASLEPTFDLAVAIEDVALAAVRPYVENAADLSGALAGTVQLRGSPDAAEIEADLGMQQGSLRVDEALLRAPLAIRARLSGPLAAPAGSFDIDASQAELAYGDLLKKASGQAASLTGRFRLDDRGHPQVDVERVKFHKFEARASLSLGPRPRVEAGFPSFDLAGWETVLPALASLGLSGGLRGEGFSVLLSPVELRGGKLFLEDVRLVPVENAPVVVRGAVEIGGGAIRTRDLAVVAAEQVIDVAAELDDPLGAQRLRLGVRAEDADSNALVSAFAGKPDVLAGPLDLTGDLSGSATDPKSLTGRIELGIEPGRLAGTPLLQAVLGKVDVGAVLGLIGQFKGTDLPEHLSGEEFERLRARLDIADGVANANDLRLDYRHYSVRLTGPIELEGLAVDMRGSLTFDAEVDRALAKLVGAKVEGRSQTIPLARVRGTLDALEPEPDREVLVALIRGYGGRAAGSRAADAISDATGDDALGEAAGALIEGIFGSGRKRREP